MTEAQEGIGKGLKVHEKPPMPTSWADMAKILWNINEQELFRYTSEDNVFFTKFLKKVMILLGVLTVIICGFTIPAYFLSSNFDTKPLSQVAISKASYQP